MELTIAPRGILQMFDARIIFRNFSGEGTQFNREGDRNFSVVIPTQEMAEDLIARGWNVKIKAPREEGDLPRMHLPVKIKFNDRGPNVYLITGKNRIRLDERTIGRLDRIDIANVDIVIRPYDWTLPSGKTGRSAYLQSIEVTQDIDIIAARYAEEEYPFE